MKYMRSGLIIAALAAFGIGSPAWVLISTES